MIQDIAHDTLCFFPLLRIPFILIARIGRIPLGESEGAGIQQANGIQEILGECQTILKLFFQLIRTQNQVTF